MNSTLFETARNRDAHASIRGFIYQAELTVLRWINLDSETQLELERGEDIDRISTQILDESSTQERLLEQVKSSSKPITIRTKSLAIALSNFYEHLRKNSGTKLAFRFTTNARITRERLKGKPENPPGIDQWNELYNFSQESVLPHRVARLRELLTQPSTPKGANNEEWIRWQNFLKHSTDDVFVAFVRTVELSTGSVKPESLQIDLPEKIATDFRMSVAQASSIYQRLLLFVLRLLTESGPKILGRSDLLEQLEAAASDAAILTTANFQFVVSLIGELSGRVAKIERDTQKLAPTSVLLDGGTKTFVPTGTFFGKRLLQTQTFNHCATIVGRDGFLQDVQAEIDGALEKGELLVIAMSAFPAKGKSKTMLEIATRIQRKVQTKWVRDGQKIEASSQAELEDGPVVIFCDDVQKRDDLAVLFKYLQVRKWGSVVCVATRPYGNQAIIEALIHSDLAVEEYLRSKSLPDIDSNLLLPQVRHALGTEYEQFAEEVLRLADGSLTVAFVAAALLRKRQLNPHALGLDEEFRRMVMSSYKDELLGSIDHQATPHTQKALLDLLAVAQPLEWDDSELEERIAKFLGVRESELRRLKASLVATGMVMAENQGARISPDVLADHVRDGALITNNNPTGFEKEVIASLGEDILLNLVRNFAELAWQRSYLQRPAVSFDTLWQSFTQVFLKQPNYYRLSWLKKLHPVAAFEPSKIFAVYESLLAQDGDEREGNPWGWRTTREAVLNGLAELLAISAHQEQYADVALDLMWKLTTGDLADAPEFQKTSMQQLTETLVYRRDRQLWMQEKAVYALERWSQLPNWTNTSSSPLFIARSILRMAMTESRYNAVSRSATLSRVGINATNTMPIRLKVVETTCKLADSSSPFVAFEAVGVLLEGLQPPEEMFAHQTNEEEEECFAGQYREIIAGISRLLSADTRPEILVEIEARLPLLMRRTKLAWKKLAIQSMIDMIPDTLECRLLRSTMRILPKGTHFRGTYEAEQGDLAANDMAIARELLRQSIDHETICETVASASHRLMVVQKQFYPFHLVGAIASENAKAAESIAKWCLAQPENLTPRIGDWVHAVGECFRIKAHTNYLKFITDASKSLNTHIREASAFLVTRGGSVDKVLLDEEYAAAAALVIDDSGRVRAQIVCGLHSIDPLQAKTLYRSIVIGNEENVIRAIAQNWEYSTEVPTLPDATLEHILKQLVPANSLDEAASNLSSMLAAFAKQNPGIVIDFLKDRVEHEQSLRGLVRQEDYFVRPYSAIPLRGIEGLQEAFRESGKYEEVLFRLLADMAQRDLNGSPSAGAIVAYGIITQWDQALEAIARKWITQRQIEKLQTLTEFFRSTFREFTRGNVEFVGDLFALVHERDEAVFDELADALIFGALRTDHQVRSVGQPDQVNLRLLRDSTDSAERFEEIGNAGAAKFYARLAEFAARDLDAERARDAERENELIGQ